MTTRREVLKYAGLGAGAAAASVLGVTANAKVEAPKIDKNNEQAPTKPAQTEVTDKNGKRLAPGPEIAWTKVAKKAAMRAQKKMGRHRMAPNWITMENIFQ